MRKFLLLSLIILSLCLSASNTMAEESKSKLQLVSKSYLGYNGNGVSMNSIISSDGNFIVFTSTSKNLVINDTNNLGDVFIYDIVNKKTSRVSVSSEGTQANGYSDENIPSISADGRFIAFQSYASNLVSNDTNASSDIFVHDTKTGETKIVSVSSLGDIGNGESSSPSISADGRYVAFESYSNNLVLNDTNYRKDIFVHDLESGVTRRVNLTSTGLQTDGDSYQPKVSPDGKFVVFVSNARNLDNSYGSSDLFLHSLDSGLTKRISPKGSSPFKPFISASGQFIVYYTNSSSGIMIYDVKTDSNESVLQEYNSSSYNKLLTISSDGRYVTFSTTNTLASGDLHNANDIYLLDRLQNKIELISVYETKSPLYRGSYSPSISGDGRYIAFTTDAKLLDEDNNNLWDIFLYDRGVSDQTAPTTTTSITGVQGQNNWYTSNVVVSLSATDEEGGTGVAKTEYSFDNLNWTTYTTPITVEQEGINVIYYRSKDNAGNLEVAKEQIILIDKTAPTLFGAPTTPANENGWYNTDIYVGFYADDALSGVASVTPKVTVTTEGKDQSVVGVAVDNAGNQTTFEVTGINIDKTPPTIKGEIATMTYFVGWYKTDVTVRFFADDYGSGVAEATPEVVLTKEGEGQTAVGYAIDRAGNYAKSVVENINIDKTAPKVASNMVDGAEFERFGVFTLENTATDNLSGIAIQTTYLDGKVIANSGETNLEKLAFGQHTLIVKARDKAGNISNSLLINFTVTAKVETIKKLVDKYYAQGLIDNKGIYNSLVAKLNKNDLTSFVSEVKSQKGKHIDEVAADKLVEYANWLLKK